MADDRGAVLQFEINLKRWRDSKPSLNGYYGEDPIGRLYNMAKTAAADTLRAGGTFVLVVSSDRVTMVQRPDAVDLPSPPDDVGE